VHPSLLPRWRGAAPIERAIMAGDDRTGVSIMRLTAGLDSGPVCLAQEQPIAGDDDYGSLAGRLAAAGGRLLVQALDELGAGSLAFSEQDEAQATYAAKIEASDRVLNAGRPAAELARVVRALSPHIGAAVILGDGSRLGVWRATAHPAGAGDLAPGELSLEGTQPVLGCTPGTLALTEVQPPGRRAMPGDAYLRGHRG
ncbi:MAG TPA: methionyl-tRNA formyltransferase, partial [Solirubrobacteraceae bacterium]|nr:methionyl-tRNA formyltransferase [Solirubrobacteraceae bacterium]